MINQTHLVQGSSFSIFQLILYYQLLIQNLLSALYFRPVMSCEFSETQLVNRVKPVWPAFRTTACPDCIL